MADNDIIKQNKTEITSPHGELFKDACSIIEQARAAAYRSVNDALIKRNWLLGLRIQHEVLKDQRAEYGEQVIMKLAEELIDNYQNHPDFFQLPIGKSSAVYAFKKTLCLPTIKILHLLPRRLHF